VELERIPGLHVNRPYLPSGHDADDLAEPLMLEDSRAR